MLLPLKGGAYTARSLIADAQVCVNLYPEQNPEDSEAPTTHYPTPGLTLLSPCPVPAQGRGLYRATNGNLYAVVGSNLYYIDPMFVWHLLGAITTKVNPVSMVDNAVDLVLVDGSVNGWQVVLSTNAFSQIVDPNFVGADRVDYVDTFLLFNDPGTQDFYSTHSNGVVFDPLYFAAKTSFPDILKTLIVMHRDIWLIGELTSEIWYNAGNPGFPFAITPGVFVEHGTASKYSIAKHDLAVFWITYDKDGQAVVVEGSGYLAKRISTHAIEQEISSYPTISDAYGMTYQQQGHVFYVLTFPTAGKTWVYDRTSRLWHQRVSYNPATQQFGQWLPGALYNAYGVNLALDYFTGALYKIDLSNGYDNNQPIIRRRGFPHLTNDGKRTRYHSFIADMDYGNSQIQDDNQVDDIFLRWSDDRGHSWSQPVAKSLASMGQFGKQAIWRRLGNARDRVFELYWSTPTFTALNGAYIDMSKSRS